MHKSEKGDSSPSKSGGKDLNQIHCNCVAKKTPMQSQNRPGTLKMLPIKTQNERMIVPIIHIHLGKFTRISCLVFSTI